MWRVFLVHFISGTVGPQIDYKQGTMQWTVSLNNAETLSLTVKKASLPLDDRETWLRPWWGGILLTYNDIPVFVGPILNRPTETFTDLQIDCGSVRNILAKRLAIPELTDWTQIAKQTVSYSGLNLGTIASRLVKLAQSKQGGYLPISYPVPELSGPNDWVHARNYQGFNLTNLGVDYLLTNLSDVTDGPDIMFRPRMLDASRFTLDMWTGTDVNPRIAQSRIVEWDLTAVNSSAVDLSIVSTGSYQTNRVYAAGAGSDQGTKIVMSEDLSDLPSGFPLLESAISDSQSEDLNTVKQHADRELNTNKGLLREIAFTVRADADPQLGTYWPGDLVRIYTKGWVTLEDGVHDCRLLTMTGDDSRNLRLSMQTEKTNGSTTY